MKERIRAVLTDQARLPVPVDGLRDADDLYEAGMTSHASINVMLGLENAFDVEFPDHMLTRAVFSSVDSIASALSELMAEHVT
jgi:acyl carrier protein